MHWKVVNYLLKEWLKKEAQKNRQKQWEAKKQKQSTSCHRHSLIPVELPWLLGPTCHFQDHVQYHYHWILSTSPTSKINFAPFTPDSKFQMGASDWLFSHMPISQFLDVREKNYLALCMETGNLPPTKTHAKADSSSFRGCSDAKIINVSWMTPDSSPSLYTPLSIVTVLKQTLKCL